MKRFVDAARVVCSQKIVSGCSKSGNTTVVGTEIGIDDYMQAYTVSDMIRWVEKNIDGNHSIELNQMKKRELCETCMDLGMPV